MSNETRSQARSARGAAAEPKYSSWAASLGVDLSALSDDVTEAPKSKDSATTTAPAPKYSSWAASLGVDLSALSDDVSDEVSAPTTASAPAAKAAPERPSLSSALEKLMSFDGAVGVALVDSESGMVLGEAGSASNLGLSAAGASVILRSRQATNKALGLAEQIDDVLISLTNQVQIIHPLADNPKLFVYMIGDKTKSGLAMARYKASEADSQLQF